MENQDGLQIRMFIHVFSLLMDKHTPQPSTRYGMLLLALGQ